MEFIIIKQDSPEGDYMWNWLATHPLNVDLPDPMVAANKGEAWQYMGSFKHEDKVVHEFRHRNHPKIFGTGGTLISVAASKAMSVDCIESKEL